MMVCRSRSVSPASKPDKSKTLPTSASSAPARNEVSPAVSSVGIKHVPAASLPARTPSPAMPERASPAVVSVRSPAPLPAAELEAAQKYKRMADTCRQKSAALKAEKKYQEALDWMQEARDLDGDIQLLMTGKYIWHLSWTTRQRNVGKPGMS